MSQMEIKVLVAILNIAGAIISGCVFLPSSLKQGTALQLDNTEKTYKRNKILVFLSICLIVSGSIISLFFLK